MSTRRSRAPHVCHVAPILTGVLIIGCAGSTPPVDSGAPPIEGVELRVVNSRLHDLIIYVLPVSSSSEHRLGLVRAVGRENLIIPLRFVKLGGFALLARPIGRGQPIVSREIVVEPTDVVELRLENNRALAKLRIRRR